MAKKTKEYKKKDDCLEEVLYHYEQWTEDRDQRMSRENGWNDVMDAYFGNLPDNWPYISRVVDPVLRTTIIEKKSRLTNSKLRGRLVPREGGDIIGARINNALLDFQWDNAQDGGSMNYKWGEMDGDARLFESSFGLTLWKYEEDEEGKVIFNGNEFKKLDPRDVGFIDGDNIRNAKWAQVSEFLTMEELENENQLPGEPKYPGLPELKKAVAEGVSDKRENNYTSRIKSLKGLADRLGDDKVFPVIEIVTEYRTDRWITFSPKHKVVLRDIDNPYKHRKIPIVQLKYFPLSDDARGESEVESVLPLWRAIQATLNGFLDTMNVLMKPPLKIKESGVRMETIEYVPDGQMIMDSMDNVQAFQGSGEPLKYFQTAYSALKSAFANAMGDSSQGIGGVDPFNPQKTATEIRDTAEQRNVRDQANQNSLSDALKDMMSMWMSNNKQFLFADPNMSEYLLKIVGERDFAFLKNAGLSDMVLDHNSTQMIADIINERGGDLSDSQLQQVVEAGSMPRFPVVENPTEKDPEKIRVKPKMSIDETGTEAEISLVPDDLNGVYNYIPDVKSMAAGADAEFRKARRDATDLLFNNQSVLQLLRDQGVQPNVKEILTESFEEAGTRDASRYFTEVAPVQQAVAGVSGTAPSMDQSGLPTVPPAPPQAGQQMARPPGLQR